MSTTATKKMTAKKVAEEIDTIEIREAEVLASVDAAKADLTKAEEDVEKYEEAADLADEAAESITDAWNAGDESIPALDYAVANAEVERAKCLLVAAQNRVRSAGKVINTDKTLARIIAPLIEQTNAGFTFTPSFLNPGEPADTQGYIVQTTPTVDGYSLRKGKAVIQQGTGIVSGEVTVLLYRDVMLRSLTERGIVDAALRQGIELETGNLSTRPCTTSDGREVDSLTITVKSAHESVPAIPREPSSSEGWKLAHRVALDLVSTTQPQGGRAIQLGQDGNYMGRNAEASGTHVSAHSAYADGQRATTVKLGLSFRIKAGNCYSSQAAELSSGTNLRKNLESLLDDYRGTFHAGLGVVTGHEVTGNPHATDSSSVSVSVTFASRAA